MSDEVDALTDFYYGTETESDWWEDMDKDEREDYGNSFRNFRNSMRNVITDDHGCGRHSKSRSRKSERRRAARSEQIERQSKVYDTNKAARNGVELKCPSCEKTFIKKSYQQAFCCTQCKDDYWNLKRSKT